MSIGSGVLLPGVVEIPTFPILRPLAYTTGLGYRPTCERYEIRPKLLLMTNRKLHMFFRLAPRLMTLNDLELL